MILTLRATGAVFVACACALAGVASDRAGRHRLHTVESWCLALSELREELRFHALPLGELLRTASQKTTGESSGVLKILADDMDHTEDGNAVLLHMSELITQEELAPVRNALTSLGRCPASQQIQALDEARNHLLCTADSMRNEVSIHGRISRTTGVSVGAMLALLLW